MFWSYDLNRYVSWRTLPDGRVEILTYFSDGSFDDLEEVVDLKGEEVQDYIFRKYVFQYEPCA